MAGVDDGKLETIDENGDIDSSSSMFGRLPDTDEGGMVPFGHGGKESDNGYTNKNDKRKISVERVRSFFPESWLFHIALIG